VYFTAGQARKFMLLKQGLTDKHKFAGKQGAFAFVRQAGCIQFDPVDVCGRNADLTLQSRVKGYTKDMLDELLYKDRLLLDYPDKNTSIICAEDWPYFGQSREGARRRAAEHPELMELMEQTMRMIGEKGAVCPDDIQLDSDFKWRAYIVWSSGKNLSASVMEQLYGCGDLVVHHKSGARKFYDLAARHLPAGLLNAADPLADAFAFQKWTMLRRVGAIGLFWNRPSDAFWRFGTEERDKLFSSLLEDGRVTEAAVEGSRAAYYLLTSDLPLVEFILTDPILKPRCELLAPLDCFLWDRQLIRTIFNYHYQWEIYTPAVKRKYGHYVLPLLYGEQFAGRAEIIADRKNGALDVKNIWYEDGFKQNQKFKTALDACLKRFMRFNDCAEIRGFIS